MHLDRHRIHPGQIGATVGLIVQNHIKRVVAHRQGQVQNVLRAQVLQGGNACGSDAVKVLVSLSRAAFTWVQVDPLSVDL